MPIPLYRGLLRIKTLMSINLKAIFIIAIALISTCSSSSEESPKPTEENKLSSEIFQVRVYECNRYKFSAEINSRSTTLYLPSGTVTLERVPAASGAKYQNPQILFWNKGDEALLEIQDQTYNCQRNALRKQRNSQGN